MMSLQDASRGECHDRHGRQDCQRAARSPIHSGKIRGFSGPQSAADPECLRNS